MGVVLPQPDTWDFPQCPGGYSLQVSTLVAAFLKNRPLLIYGKHFKHAELSKKKKILGVYIRSFPEVMERRKYLAQDLSHNR